MSLIRSLGFVYVCFIVVIEGHYLHCAGNLRAKIFDKSDIFTSQRFRVSFSLSNEIKLALITEAVRCSFLKISLQNGKKPKSFFRVFCDKNHDIPPTKAVLRFEKVIHAALH